MTPFYIVLGIGLAVGMLGGAGAIAGALKARETVDRQHAALLKALHHKK